MSEYLYEDDTYKIIGALIEVHKNLGKGFSEIVYKDAFEYELKKINFYFEREKEYLVHYKDIILNHKFYADFVV
jgi:GxxExxY protein